MSDTGDSADGLGSKLGNIGKVAAVGLAGIAVAAVGAGTALYKIGASFDDAYDTIRTGTGATGKSLQGLEQDFKSVVSSVPTDFGSASTAVTDLNQRLGLTGKPLQDLSEQFINLARVSGVDLPTAIEAGTRVFGNWKIATEDQGTALDFLYKVSQQTGVGVDSLMQTVVDFGAPLREMGFSFEESAALVGKWAKEGVNTEAVLGSLRRAMTTFAKAGVQDTHGALIQLIDDIKNAGSSSDATKLAMQAFGSKGAGEMAAAIRDGRLSVDDLVASLDASHDTINTAAEDTFDLAEKWTLFKNRALVAIEPVATRIFGLAGTIVDKLSPALLNVTQLLAAGDWKGGLRFAADTLGTIGQKALDLAGNLTGKLQSALGAIDWSGLFGDALSKAGSLAEDVGAWLLRSITGVDWPGLGKEALTRLGSALSGAVDLGIDLGATFLALVTGTDWGAVASEAWSRLQTALSDGADLTWDAGTTVAGWVTDVGWIDLARTILTDIRDGFLTVVDLAWDGALWVTSLITGTDWTGIARTILTRVRDGFLTIVDLAWDAGSWIASLITGQDWSGIARTTLTRLRDGLLTITDLTWDGAQWVLSLLKDVKWDAVADAIKQGIATAVGAVDWSQLTTLIAEKLQPPDDGKSQSGWDKWAQKLHLLIEPIVTSVTNLGSAVGDAVDSVVDFSGALSDLWDALAPWREILPPLTLALEAIAGAALWVLIHTILGPIDLLTQKLEAFAGMLTILTTAIEIASPVIEGLGNALIYVRDHAPEAASGISDFATSASGFLTDLVTTATTATGDLVSGIVTGLGGLIEQTPSIMSGWVDSTLGFLDDLWHDGTQKVEDLASDIVQSISDLAFDVAGPAATLYSTLYGFIRDMVDDGIKKVQGLPGEVESAVTGSVSWLYSAGWDAIKGLYDGMVAAVANFDPVGYIEGIGGDILHAMDPFHNSPWPGMIEHGYTAIQGLAMGLQQGVATLNPAGIAFLAGASILANVAAGASGSSGISNLHDALFTTYGNAGHAITDGLLTGIQTGTPAASQGARGSGKGIGGAFVAGAAGNQGVGEPSFHDYLFGVYSDAGTGIPEGTAAGITVMTPAAAAEAGAAGNKVGIGFGSGVAGAASGGAPGSAGIGTVGGGQSLHDYLFTVYEDAGEALPEGTAAGVTAMAPEAAHAAYAAGQSVGIGYASGVADGAAGAAGAPTGSLGGASAGGAAGSSTGGFPSLPSGMPGNAGVGGGTTGGGSGASGSSFGGPSSDSTQSFTDFQNRPTSITASAITASGPIQLTIENVTFNVDGHAIANAITGYFTDDYVKPLGV